MSDEVTTSTKAKPPRKTGNPVGRPKKAKLPRGRPKGEAAIMKDYRMRMLRSPNSPYVLQKIMEAALDDEHKHQAAAWKIWADRVMPLDGFKPESKEGAKIEINITTHGDPASVDVGGGEDESDEGAIDVEFTEVDGD